MWLEQATDVRQCFSHICGGMQDTSSNDNIKIVPCIALQMRVVLNIE